MPDQWFEDRHPNPAVRLSEVLNVCNGHPGTRVMLEDVGFTDKMPEVRRMEEVALGSYDGFFNALRQFSGVVKGLHHSR